MKVMIIHGGTIFDGLGGSEVQLNYIAEYLRSQGHQVFYYTMNLQPEKPELEVISGFRIYRNNSIRNGLLLPYRQIGRALEIVEKEKPDIMFARCMRTPYIFYRVSKKTRTPFVYQLPSMFSDDIYSFRRSLENIKKFRSNIFNPFLAPRYFWKADCVLTISRDDAIAIATRFNIRVQTIYNMHPVPELSDSFGSPPKVVWINNFKHWKHPELFIDLARQCKGINAEFIMAGKMPESQYGENLREMMRETPNLKYLGQISFEESNRLLDTAYLNVLSSSSREGFGNANIQGWMRQVPLVTTMDKDCIVRNNGLGAYVTGVDQLVDRTRYFLENQEERNAASSRARAFAVKNFSINSNGPKYEQLFAKAIK